MSFENDLEDINLDGKNIWPFLTGEKKVAEERSMYWKTGQAYAVREGNWKLLVHRNSGQTELFNLENDFRETRNLRESHPEKVKHLMNLMVGFQKGDR